jgi:hypothetical protein
MSAQPSGKQHAPFSIRSCYGQRPIGLSDEKPSRFNQQELLPKCISNEASNLYVLSDLLNMRGNMFLDADGRIFDKRLFQHARFRIKLGDSSFNDFLHDILGFPC